MTKKIPKDLAEYYEGMAGGSMLREKLDKLKEGEKQTGEKPKFLEITEILEGKTERSKKWLKGAEEKVNKKVMKITAIKKLPNGNMEMKGEKR